MGAWLSIHPIIPCFHPPSDVFSYVLQIRLGFPHPLVLGLTHCIYGQLLNRLWIHLLHCAHGRGKTTSHDVVQDRFYIHCERCGVSCFSRIIPHSFATFSSVFFSTSWHCFVGWWHMHIGQCCHCQTHSNKLGITGGYFSWDDYDINSSNWRKGFIVTLTQWMCFSLWP